MKNVIMEDKFGWPSENITEEAEVTEEKSVSQMSDEDLLDLLIASKALEKLHKGKGGLEQHLAHSEKKTEEYKAEILKRMKSGK